MLNNKICLEAVQMAADTPSRRISEQARFIFRRQGSVTTLVLVTRDTKKDGIQRSVEATIQVFLQEVATKKSEAEMVLMSGNT